MKPQIVRRRWKEGSGGMEMSSGVKHITMCSSSDFFDTKCLLRKVWTV